LDIIQQTKVGLQRPLSALKPFTEGLSLAKVIARIGYYY
jgi:hypothetical protein